MSERVSFFYAHGTAFLVNFLNIGFSIPLFPATDLDGNPRLGVIPGLNGQTASWDGRPQTDPFTGLLDPDKFDVVKVEYPASVFPIGSSIDEGISRVVSAIQNLPPGKPFAIGGYSQGAAVASGVYNEIRYGSLTSRNSSFLGGVCFGNPRRQQNYRGGIGGTWSGAWDITGSETGGAGCFQSTGNWARLSNCEPERWIEFTTSDDIFSSTGFSSVGNLWRDFLEMGFNVGRGGIINFFVSALTGAIEEAVNLAMQIGNAEWTYSDAVGDIIKLPGAGHLSYALSAPEGLTGQTSYQLALSFLDSLADEWATAPSVIPPNFAGWSTTLLPSSIK